MTTPRRTLTEALDNAANGEEWMAALLSAAKPGWGDTDMPQPPAWFGNTLCKYTSAIEDGALVIRYPGGNKDVKWRSDCTYCAEGCSSTDFYPSHTAMSNCRSGGRNHCTCDGCF